MTIHGSDAVTADAYSLAGKGGDTQRSDSFTLNFPLDGKIATAIKSVISPSHKRR